jgi:phosphoglycerate dehydrogenase-like enzyme
VVLLEAGYPPPRADLLLLFSAARAPFEGLWGRLEGVRWVHSLAAGVDKVLFPAFVNSAIPLTNSRGVFSRALGEFALGAVLFFAKDFRRMVTSQEAGRWDPFDVEEIYGRTLGIVGYGDIGRAVAERARGLGMKILASRRRPELSRGDPLLDEVYSAADRHELLTRSDYVVVVAPLTPDTRGLVGGPEIGAMKKTAVLINIGRGAVVDETALVQALEARRIRGAALDVFESEPLPLGHPLYRLDNVLLSPHCADHTPGWLEGAVQFFLQNVERFRRGETLLNVVDKAQGY